MKALTTATLQPLIGVVATGIDRTTTGQTFEVESSDVGHVLPGYLGTDRALEISPSDVGRKIHSYGGWKSWVWAPTK